MSTSKSNKQSKAVKPSTALPQGTVKVPARTRTTPVSTLPVETGPLPVVKIPVATQNGTSLPTATAPTITPTSSASSPTATSPPTPAASTLLDAPPTVDAPPVPEAFKLPTSLRGLRGFSPNEAEMRALPGLVADLNAFTDYVTVLGASAPSASAVGSCVGIGLAWRKSRTSAEAWAGYVKTEDAMAWKAAQQLLDELKPLFLIAASKNATLAGKYPALAAYCNAAKEVSAAASATRKKNAATKAAAAAAATTAAAVAAAKAEAVAPVAKGVTVNA